MCSSWPDRDYISALGQMLLNLLNTSLLWVREKAEWSLCSDLSCPVLLPFVHSSAIW